MGHVAADHVLICHSIIHQFMGSTMVTLDVATSLIERGSRVVVYAAFVDDPVAAIFRSRGIDLIDDQGTADLRLEQFDLVWVNSQVLPVDLVTQLAEVPADDLPAFVFHHMSCLPSAADEHPYIHQLEERLSSLSIFVSQETKDALSPFYAHMPPSWIHANPAPMEFVAHQYQPRVAPRKVLIISNHAVPEVDQAAQLLRDQGLEVQRIGGSHEHFTLVTAEILADADVVMTIGKSVQYCLVSARPVYVYDRFGGPGYLTADNFDDAAYHNFSGRGGRALSGHEIVRELIDGYGAAVSFHADRHADMIDRYAIDPELERLLGAIQPRVIEPLEPSYLRMLRSAEEFGARFYRYWGYNAHEVEMREARERVLREAGEIERQRDAAWAELEQLRGSWSFRLGRLLTRPLSLVRRFLSRDG